MTLSDAFSLYRDEVIVLKGQSLRTEEGFLVSAKVISEYYEDKSILELTVSDVRRFHTSLLKRLSVNTIRGYLFHLKSVLTHCKLNGMPVIDPELIIIPKREQTVPDYLTPEEIDKILKCIVVRRGSNHESVLRDRALVSILYASGMRASEVISLDREKWEDKKATIIGKGGKPRLVFWDERTHNLLRDYLEARTDTSPALFVSTTGQRLKRHSLVSTFIRLQKLCGCDKLHAHTLRHSYATNLMQNGMHIYTISKLMGHSSIQTTSRYLHVSDPRLQEEYERFHST